MENFEFKSQICTTKEQSEKLLALGLKKETADVKLVWLYCYKDEDYYQPMPNDFSTSNDDIPAWSLHRLMEMINLKIQFRLKEKATVIYNVSHLQPFQSFSGFGIDGKSYYNSIINAIEWLIKEGYFNKDYLEEK